MNPTLELLDARSSTRVYTPEPISDADKNAILSATFRAPTGGNMRKFDSEFMAEMNRSVAVWLERWQGR